MSPIDAPPVLLGEWARVIAAALVDGGVRHAVVSPGSRSTPFVLALGARSELACLDVVDERCAAFVALGIARACARPVALLCTSGTAAAHWYPAVIEASLVGAPLVLLTADRPAELAHCGAAQTIDQIKMFGDHVRHFADLGSPESSEIALRGLRRAITQAISIAATGPVHLDLRARKPLEPIAPRDERDRALAARVDALLAQPATAVPAPRAIPDREAIDGIASALDAAVRPLIVAGPLAAAAIEDGTRSAALAIARASGAPIYAEATSQLRFAPRGSDVVAIDALDVSIRTVAPEDEPDLVIQIGASPTSSALDRFLAERPSLERIVIGVERWADPHASARTMVLGEPAAALGALANAIGRTGSRLDRGWRDRMIAADRRAWSAIEHELETGGFGEGTIARTLIAALPERAQITIGNSLPIRTIDRFVPGGRELVVLSQRGANGIDGIASGAIGAAIARASPGAVMLGDLSMQHDLGALASAGLVQAPLAIVVVQNGGGRIFEQLPIAEAAPAAIERFTTPQRVRFEHAAAAFGVPYARALEPGSLRSAIDRALAGPGVTLIEAIVPPQGARDSERRILARAGRS